VGNVLRENKDIFNQKVPESSIKKNTNSHNRILTNSITNQNCFKESITGRDKISKHKKMSTLAPLTYSIDNQENVEPSAHLGPQPS
jgi:hypothetical protein